MEGEAEQFTEEPPPRKKRRRRAQQKITSEQQPEPSLELAADAVTGNEGVL